MEKVDIVIIGAGVVGLAIGSEITRKKRDVYILEKESSYGKETSSRNSEVIHAGLYYPKDSLKARLCVDGNPMVYQICKKNNVAYKRIGKMIVATKKEEEKQLEKLLQQGRANGITNLKIIDEEEIHGLEPQVKATSAIYSPSTGIIDVHGLMDFFYRKMCQNSGIDPLVCNTEVINLVRDGDGYIIRTRSENEVFSLKTELVINTAGLYADKIAEMVGIDINKEQYRLHWCKGDYYSLIGKPPVKMLVYPSPPMKEYHGWLGIHTVPDIMGRLRFGPNAYYVDGINYQIESKLDNFWRDIISYLPSIKKNTLKPDISGIRPKLNGPNEPFRDFIIQHEEDKGFSGLINLIGIESPGLTCAPAIAKMVSKIVDKIS
jgi:L-2-hydroxyglutarate oxidase LhgO